MRNGLDEIHAIRDCQLNRGLRVLAVLGSIPLVASLCRVSDVGWHSIMYLHIGIYLTVLGAAILSSHLSFFLRASVVIGVPFFLGIAGLATWGLAGLGIPALFTFCIVSTMFFGVRAGILSAVISVAVIGMVGAGVVHGIVTFDFNPEVYLASASAWMTGVIGMTVVAGLVVVILGTINFQMGELVEVLDVRNEELLEANSRLKTEMQERDRLEKEGRELEASLQRAKKMEIVGTLAGGVAHDLNNILTAIVGYPEILLLQLPPDSSLREILKSISISGMRAATIVDDLLTLARRGVGTVEVTNLNLIVEEYLKTPEYRRLKSYHPGVSIRTDLQEDLSNTVGSPVHLSKALMNLVSNAAEAMPRGGSLSIRTENRRISEPTRAYDENIAAGNYAVLSVADTGTGISPEEKEKIFEPFYTKKVMGRSGTGLGMAVVWGTVKDYKGYLQLESVQGEGTLFALYFPITAEPLPQVKPVLTRDQYRGRGESILIVDDLKEHREIAHLMLSQLGYSVTTVSSGEEAVAYLEHESADLIILDMIMDPGMDGLDTCRRILELCPGQKVIIASGYSETDRLRKVRGLGTGAYLRKPYSLERIGLTVRAEIERLN